MSYLPPCWNLRCPPNIGPKPKFSKPLPGEIQVLKMRQQEEKEIAHEQANKIESLIVRQKEFLDQTNTRMMYQEVRRLVNCAKAAQLDELNMKRERLRAFLAEEDACYEQEFQTVLSGRIEEDISKRKEQLATLTREREENRRKLAEQKLMQQTLINSPHLRSEIQQQMLLQSKRDQLVQVQERQALKAVERDIDNMWHDIGMKRLEEQNREAQNQQRIAFLNSKCCEEELKRQILLKKQRSENDAHEDTRACCVKDEVLIKEVDKAEIQRRQCVENAAYIRKQVKEKRIKNECMKKEANAFEASIIEACISEIQKEEAALRDNKKILHDESIVYLNYLKKIKCDRKLDEIELDKLIGEINKKIEEEKTTSRCNAFAKKREIEKGINAELRQQIADRADFRRIDSQTRLCEAIVERELNLKLIAADRETKMKRFLGKVEDAKNLLQQAAETERLRTEAEKLQTDKVKRMQKEQVAREEAAITLYRRQAQNIFPVHPNTRVLNDFKPNANPF